MNKMIPLLGRRLSAPEPAARIPARTSIKITWEEAVARQIDIRHHNIGTAPKICAIYLKIGCPPKRYEPLAADAAQLFSGSKSERRTT